MKGKDQAINQICVEKEGADEAAVNKLSREVIFGDLIWVRLHGSSWWPAQVVDENTVSGSKKPSDRSVGEVLVRLYGSYKYLYVDPVNFYLEFENVLKQNNGSHSEILKKALEQDLPHFKSGLSKGKKSPEGNEGTKQLGMKKKKFDNETSYQARVSPRILAANTVPTKVKNGNLHLDKTEEERSRKRKQERVQKKLETNSPKSAMVSRKGPLSENTEVAKSRTKREQDGVHKKLKTNHPSSVRISPRRSSAETKPQTLVKNGNVLSEKAEGAEGKIQKCPSSLPQTTAKKGNSLSEKTNKGLRSKAPNLDGMQKNPKPSNPSTLALSPKTLQTTMKNGNLLSEKAVEETKDKRPKEVGMQKKLKPHRPESATTSVGKSQELSARRMKVMQSLGLIAPSGSPFHRNGQISSSLVLCE